MNNRPLIYLSAADVQAAMPMAAAIDAMRKAFPQLSQGQVSMPARECMQATDGVDLVMPCYGPQLGYFCLKSVTVYPGNTENGLPMNQGMVILTDSATGSHLAIIDGSSLTSIRTGAASGLATDLLARKDAKAVAMFSGGVQARTQLEAICTVRTIEQVRVYDQSRERAERFAEEMSSRLEIPVTVSDTPAENIKDADIIGAATSSRVPVFDDNDLPRGVHINAAGVFHPDRAEIPPATVCRARVVVDHLEAALDEAGDVLLPWQAGLISKEHFATELGAVVLGEAPGRQSDDEITLFKSVGVAAQDICAAACVYENATRLGLGKPLD
jgi:ornithine cyclodeaminase/alanine dehydrogenase-like protein (mu-crystallin family)